MKFPLITLFIAMVLVASITCNAQIGVHVSLIPKTTHANSQDGMVPASFKHWPFNPSLSMGGFVGLPITRDLAFHLGAYYHINRYRNSMIPAYRTASPPYRLFKGVVQVAYLEPSTKLSYRPAFLNRRIGVEAGVGYRYDPSFLWTIEQTVSISNMPVSVYNTVSRSAWAYEDVDVSNWSFQLGANYRVVDGSSYALDIGLLYYRAQNVLKVLEFFQVNVDEYWHNYEPGSSFLGLTLHIHYHLGKKEG